MPDFEMLHLAGNVLKCCVWLASGGRETQCFKITRQTQRFKIRCHGQAQNLPPNAIFCDHASDMYHEWHSVYIQLIKGPLNTLGFLQKWKVLAMKYSFWSFLHVLRLPLGCTRAEKS